MMPDEIPETGQPIGKGNGGIRRVGWVGIKKVVLHRDGIEPGLGARPYHRGTEGVKPVGAVTKPARHNQGALNRAGLGVTRSAVAL